jgi:ADP-ribosylglycohydrolase
MIGAIAGAIIECVCEFSNEKPDYDFPLFSEHSHFTDDIVLTIAIADSIVSCISKSFDIK